MRSNGYIYLQVMYESKARLMCSAEGTPFDLFERIVTISDAQQMAPRTSSRSRKNDDFDLCVDNELGFAKERTISRCDTLPCISFISLAEESVLFAILFFLLSIITCCQCPNFFKFYLIFSIFSTVNKFAWFPGCSASHKQEELFHCQVITS